MSSQEDLNEVLPHPHYECSGDGCFCHSPELLAAYIEAHEKLEADAPTTEGDLHPYKCEVLRAFGLFDIPARSEQEAVARFAAWLYREGHIVVEQQDEPRDVALYLSSIATL